jgi:hypothetical protein
MDVKKLLEPILRGTISGFIQGRNQRKLDLEQVLTEFTPNAGEASDLLDAIAAGLKKRYEQDDCTEALLHLSMARNALDRLDIGYQVDAREELEALESMRRRMEKKSP